MGLPSGTWTAVFGIGLAAILAWAVALRLWVFRETLTLSSRRLPDSWSKILAELFPAIDAPVSVTEFQQRGLGGIDRPFYPKPGDLWIPKGWLVTEGHDQARERLLHESQWSRGILAPWTYRFRLLGMHYGQAEPAIGHGFAPGLRGVLQFLSLSVKFFWAKTLLILSPAQR